MHPGHFFVVVPRLESSLVASLLSPLPWVAPPQRVLFFWTSFPRKWESLGSIDFYD